MTRQDWTKIFAASLISVFIGLYVTAMIIYKKRSKLLSKKSLQKLVQSDLDFWNGLKEWDLKGAEKIVEYWKLIGLNFTVPIVQTSSHRNTWYWSAIYISNLMERWGADSNFKYASSHAVYIIDGKRALAEQDKDSIFYSYKPSEISVEVGDLVGKSRKSGINLDNITSGSPTHTDLVYDIKKEGAGYVAYAIGGNMGDTVMTSKYVLDSDKKLRSPSGYLVVMKNQKV